MTTLTEWAHKHGVTGAALRELIEIIYPDVNSLIPDPESYENESQVQAQIRLEAPKHGAWLGRNNRGAMMNDKGRLVRFGLANDSDKIDKVFKTGDLVGGTQRMVMPEHIGQIWDIYTNVEVKEPGWRFTPGDKRAVAQLACINYHRKRGGIAGFCTSVIDYRNLLQQPIMT